jgi:hypothetical protein
VAIPYTIMRFGLIAALVAVLTATFASGMSVLGLLASVVLAMLLCYAVYAHRGELAKLYQTREARASQPHPSDKLVWGAKPRLINFAPGMVICGPFLIAMGYYVLERPHRPSRSVLQVLYDAFGPAGESALFSLLGIVLIVYGAEAIVGHRLGTRRA